MKSINSILEAYHFLVDNTKHATIRYYGVIF
jgi:hypothetical protein